MTMMTMKKLKKIHCCRLFIVCGCCFFVPGAVIALAVAAQVDVATVFAIGGFDWVNPFGAAAALLASIMWMLNPLTDFRLYICRSRPLPSRVADMTNFITFWVICGYIAYGLVAEVFILIGGLV